MYLRRYTELTERTRFLWAKLQIDLLCCKKTEHDIVESLQNGLTEGLDAIYGDILSTISTMTDGLASRILVRLFSWLLYARMPLTRELIDAALAVDLDDDDGMETKQSISKSALGRIHIFGIGLNLILEDERTNIIHFCHPSVKDYLRSHPMFTPSTAELYLATGCLRQCIEGPSSKPYSHLSSCATDLYHYAAVHWHHHVSAAGRTLQEMPAALRSGLVSFVFADDDSALSVAFLVWLDWVRAVSDELPPYHHLKGDFDTLLSQDPSPLFAMAVFGLRSLLDHLPSADLDALNERGHTSLYLACLHGHLDMAKALLARGADPDVQCGSHGSPLGAACYRGHGSLVEMLLSHDALRRSQAVFGTAFEKACSGQHESIATMLVQHSEFPHDTKSLEKAGRQAAEAGFRDLVNWLYSQPQPGAPATTDGITKAMMASVRGGRVQVLQSFLRTRPQLKDRLPADAIAIAAAHGHIGMVKFLHDQGFSASVESLLGSPLRNASLIDHVPLLRTLLGWGESIDARGERGSALQAAASRGHKHAVCFLIAEGANVNLSGQPWGTALQAASYGGHLDVVRVLLENGADVHQKGKFKDAFYAAVKGGHEAVAAELLERGYKYVPLNHDGRNGSSMLPIARGDDAPEDDGAGFRGEDEEGSRDRLADDLASSEGESEDTDSFETLTRRLVQYSGPGGENSTMRRDVMRARWKLLQPPDDGFPEACVRFAAEEGNLGLLQMTLTEAATLLKHPESSVFEGVTIAASARRFEVLEYLLENLGTLPYDSWRKTLLLVATTGNCSSIARTLHCSESLRREELRTATEAVEKLPLSPEAARMEAASCLVDWMLCVDDVAEWQEWATRRGDHTYDLGFLIRAAAASTSKETFRLLLNFVETHQLFQPAESFDGLVSLATAAAAGRNQANTWLLLEKARAADVDSTPPAAPSTSGATESNPLRTSAAATGNRNLSLARWASQRHWKDEHGPVTICQAIFISAAEGGAIKILRQILQIDAFRDSPDFVLTVTQGLVTACVEGHTRAARLCLRNHADVNMVVAVRAVQSGMDDSDSDSDGPTARGRGADGGEPADRYGTRSHKDSPAAGSGKERLMLNALQAALMRLGSLDRAAPASVRNRQEALAMLILQHGGDPNDRGGRHVFPLQVAASLRGSWQLIQALLDAGAEPDCGETWPSHASERPINLASPVKWTVDFKNAGLAVLQLIRAGAPVPLTESGELAEGLHRCIDRWSFIDAEVHDRIAVLAREALDGGLRDLVLAILNRLPRLEAGCFANVLLLAATIGDHAIVNSLTRPGRSVILYRNMNGATALDLAAEYGQAEVMSKLLRRGAEPSLRKIWPCAIKAGNLRVLELLKAHTPTSYFKENSSWMLREAVFHGSKVVFDLVLASGTVGPLREEACEAMVTGCKMGRQVMVSRLLEAGAMADGPTKAWKLSMDHSSPLYWACRNGHVAIAKELLAHGARNRVIGDGYWPESLLLTAARHNRAGVTRVLLEAGLDPNWKFDAENQSADFNDLRASYLKARLPYRDDTAFHDHISRLHGTLPFEKFFPVEAGRQVPKSETRPYSALVEACRHNSASVVRELIRWGASALHSSSQPDLARTLCEGEPTARRLEIVGLVLDTIDDTRGFNRFVSELVHEAVVAENAGVMGYLVDFATGDVDMLASACRCGSLHAVQTLLARGLSLDARDEQGDTLLSIAARHMHLPVVKHLLSLGADATAQNRSGMTALDSYLTGYASLGSRPFSVAAPKLEGSADLARLLIEGGARPTPDHLCAAAVLNSALSEAMLDAMLELGTPLSDLETVLFASIDAGCRSAMKALLQRGVNPHATRLVQIGEDGAGPADGRSDTRNAKGPAADNRLLTTTTQCALQAALGKKSPLILDAFIVAAPDMVIITGGVTDDDFDHVRHELEAIRKSARKADIAEESDIAVQDLALLLQHKGRLFLPTRLASDCRRNEDVWPLVLRRRVLDSIVTVSRADWDQLMNGASSKLRGRKIFRSWRGRRGMWEVCLSYHARGSTVRTGVGMCVACRKRWRGPRLAVHVKTKKQVPW